MYDMTRSEQRRWCICACSADPCAAPHSSASRSRELGVNRAHWYKAAQSSQMGHKGKGTRAAD